MPSTSQKIQPTRGELLKLKRRIELAERGHELLEEKRDALITEFFDILDQLREKRQEVRKKIKKAIKKMVQAKIILGKKQLDTSITSITEEKDIEVQSRNIMGVRVPVIEFEKEEKKITERGYSIRHTTSKLDEAAKEFEESIEKILELAEKEETVRLLSQEIEKTKRRVNSLENVLIPRLKENKEYIESRLEEQERENYFRLKKVKGKMEE